MMLLFFFARHARALSLFLLFLSASLASLGPDPEPVPPTDSSLLPSSSLRGDEL